MRRLNVQSVALHEVPDALRSSVAQMLAIDASLRPEATQLSKVSLTQYYTTVQFFNFHYLFEQTLKYGVQLLVSGSY